MYFPATIIVVTLLYGGIYASIKPDEFGFKTPLDPYYFAFTTMSSVGYGDFTPKTNRSKLLVMSQQILLLIEVSAIMGLFADKKSYIKSLKNMLETK